MEEVWKADVGGAVREALTARDSDPEGPSDSGQGIELVRDALRKSPQGGVRAFALSCDRAGGWIHAGRCGANEGRRA